MTFMCIFFFFSSRRRHTRWTGDWSSDVCSSDLDGLPLRHPVLDGPDLHLWKLAGGGRIGPDDPVHAVAGAPGGAPAGLHLCVVDVGVHRNDAARALKDRKSVV